MVHSLQSLVNTYTSILKFLCPFAVHYLCYAVTSFFTISRISLADGKRAGQKAHRKIAVAVQNVKPLYFLSRSFEIREKYCQQSFVLSIVIQLTITKETRRRVSRGRDLRWRDRRRRDCRGRVLRDFSLFKPNLINMNVHSATCSCSVELYKRWYTLADFCQTGIFAGFSLYIKLTIN